MIKKFIFTVIIISVAIFLLFYSTIEDEKRTNSDGVLSETKNENTSNDFVELEQKGNTYKILWHEISNLNSLNLYPNFEDDISSNEFMDEYGCHALFSGGFYTKTSKPIGLFLTEGEKLEEIQKNVLFNGFFSISPEGMVDVSSQIPFANPRIAIQAGPMLLVDDKQIKLNLFDDKESRRIVLGKTKNDSLVFLVVFDPSSVFLGPYLVDLPQIITKFEEESSIDLFSAINLDGGSASTFNNKLHNLEELTSVGSYFCETN